MDADPAQLGGERLRRRAGWARAAARRACAPARSLGVGRRPRGRPRRRSAVDEPALGGLGEGLVVDELAVGAWRPGCRARSRPAPAPRGRPRDRAPARSVARASQAAGVELLAVDRQRREGALEGRRGRRRRVARRAGRRAAARPRAIGPPPARVGPTLDGHGAVSELVEEPDGGDVRGGPGTPLGVIARRRAASAERARRRDDGIAVAGEQRVLEAVAVTRRPRDAEVHPAR